MLTLILALALAQAQSETPSRALRAERVQRAGGRTGGAAYAAFEAFPINGAGTTAACSTTPPTGVRGEALTFARASTATCTKTATGGFATSDIATGDLVELSNNVARVEYSGGVLGLLGEGGRTNSLTRFIDYANATWADVGTPTLTGSQASPFTGTYATSAVQFDDNDAVAFEGRSQTVTVTAAAVYTAHCYVKAGTATSARIVLDGTAATKTGLSTSTWDIIEVTDASASGVAIVFEADVGSTAATTGTVTFGGCQVENGSYRTSIIPTVASALTRGSELAYFSGSFALADGCMSVSVNYPAGVADRAWLSLDETLSFRTMLYATAANQIQMYANAAVRATTSTTPPGPRRILGYWGSGGTGACVDGACVTGVAASGVGSPNRVTIGTYASDASKANDGISSRIQVDPSPTRCR